MLIYFHFKLIMQFILLTKQTEANIQWAKMNDRTNARDWAKDGWKMVIGDL